MSATIQKIADHLEAATEAQQRSTAALICLRQSNDTGDVLGMIEALHQAAMAETEAASFLWQAALAARGLR